MFQWQMPRWQWKGLIFRPGPLTLQPGQLINRNFYVRPACGQPGPCIPLLTTSSYLSLSGAHQVDVAISMSSHHADLSKACRLVVARGRRSSFTVLSQDCLGLPILWCQSLGGPRMHTWRAREWSWLASAWLGCPKKYRQRLQIVSDRKGCPVRDRT